MAARIYAVVHLVTVRFCAAAGRLPRLVRRKIVMRFYHWFFEKFLEFLFICRGSTQFNWHHYTVASLKVPAMIVYDVVTKVFDTE